MFFGPTVWLGIVIRCLVYLLSGRAGVGVLWVVALRRSGMRSKACYTFSGIVPLVRDINALE